MLTLIGLALVGAWITYCLGYRSGLAAGAAVTRRRVANVEALHQQQLEDQRLEIIQELRRAFPAHLQDELPPTYGPDGLLRRRSSTPS